MDSFGTYFTHVQKALLWTWQPAHMEHTKYTAVRLLKTCTWQPAHMEHTKYTAVRTKVYIQQTHSACTDEALGRVYRWGPWPRVQTRPLPLRPWPEPSACTCDPGPEPSACTCDPRKRVHRRPPDLFWATVIFFRISQKIFESALPRTCKKLSQKRRTSGLRRNFLFKSTLPRNSSKKSSKTVFKSSLSWPSSKICAKCFNFSRGLSQRDPYLISRVLRSKLESSAFLYLDGQPSHFVRVGCSKL